MTEALWLTVGAAAVATAVLSVASVVLSKRGAARIDRLVAEREAADRRREIEADPDHLLNGGLADTRR